MVKSAEYVSSVPVSWIRHAEPCFHSHGVSTNVLQESSRIPNSSFRALDFLYMDYQPPGPLSVLIPPTTLSKYHRLFTFCLRLIRGESIVVY